MNAPEKLFLPDVQSVTDLRDLPIQRVGVRDIAHPVIVKTRDGEQPSVARIAMYVGLPGDVKGTHMSRFLELIQAHSEPLSCDTMSALMRTMLQRLEAASGYIEVRLPYFVRKRAPVSGVESLMDYQVTMRSEVTAGVERQTVKVVVPVTSLCPCSRDISEYGAHNQRSHVTISASVSSSVDIEDLIGAAEQAASCEVWGLLKRPDEKYVTERAYDNPKFVEDLVRDVALALNALAKVDSYVVEAENFESIHNHSAYAMIEYARPGSSA